MYYMRIWVTLPLTGWRGRGNELPGCLQNVEKSRGNGARFEIMYRHLLRRPRKGQSSRSRHKVSPCSDTRTDDDDDDDDGWRMEKKMNKKCGWKCSAKVPKCGRAGRRPISQANGARSC